MLSRPAWRPLDLRIFRGGRSVALVEPWTDGRWMAVVLEASNGQEGGPRYHATLELAMLDAERRAGPADGEMTDEARAALVAATGWPSSGAAS